MQYESKYKKIKFQCREAHKEWNNLSESYTQTKIFPDKTDVEVNNLMIDKSYEFRGLFEDSTSIDIVQLNSKENIKIKRKQHLFKKIYL